MIRAALRTAALLMVAAHAHAGPVEAMRAVHADLAAMQAEERPYYRYLVKPPSWAPKDWGYYKPVFAFHLNQLSRSAVLYKAAAIAVIGDEVLRVNVDRFGYGDVWDRLQDPYFTARRVVVKTREWGYYDAGRRWVRTKVEEAREVVTEPAQVLMDGVDDAARLNAIIAWTGSNAALVRADWFANQTGAAVDRDPGYPEFLGFRDEKSFQKLIGFDERVFKAFRFELRDAVSLGGVTLQPRAIVRWDSAGGGYWKTIDFKVAKDAKNPLEVIGEDIEANYDASEQYGVLPNGLWAMGAFNKKGDLQRIVPGDIANDHRSRSNDKAIHLAVSCIRCHGGGGLQDVGAWWRTMHLPPTKTDVYSADRKKREALEQQYLRSLQKFIADDRARYEGAVLEVTGLPSKEIAKRSAELWEKYEDAQVTPAYAAAEFGLSVTELQRRLVIALKSPDVKVRPMIGALAHSEKTARAIGIRQWEQVYGETFLLIRGVK